jgi:membrane-associated phospholipid phosphatase
MAGAGGICGLTLFLATRISQANVMFLVVAIVIAGLVAHARLKLQEHNPAQVVAGFACGFIPVFSMFAWI